MILGSNPSSANDYICDLEFLSSRIFCFDVFKIKAMTFVIH